MKLWALPVSWEVAGVAMVPADTLEDAIHAVRHDDSIELPTGYYVHGSFDITIEDTAFIREFYNHGQLDDVVPAEEDSDDAATELR